MSSYSTTRKKTQRRKESIHKWLRDRVSLDIGMKWDDHPIHCNSNDDVLIAHNQNQWWRIDKLTNERLNAHFSGTHTFYFSATGNPKQEETIVGIDIDCHHSGSLKGAAEFAEYLKENHFPNLYYEVSTNGNGVHGIVRIHKSMTGDIVLKEYLRKLDAHLKSLLAQADFDVELVEIKGINPIMRWKNGKLVDYTAGVLMRLPRCKERFEELRNTTLLTMSQLKDLPTPAKPSRAKSGVLKAKGSSTGHTEIEDSEIELLGTHYRNVALKLIGKHPLQTTGRALATLDDVAIFLMLLKVFSENMYKDGSMPWKRFAETWTQLYRDDKVSRAFDEKRFAAIRNHLSSLGLIDWEDETFVIGKTINEVYHKGKAAKWKATDEFLAVLGKDKGEEGSILPEHLLADFIDSLEKLPNNETPRPKERQSIPIWLDPDRVTSLLAA